MRKALLLIPFLLFYCGAATAQRTGAPKPGEGIETTLHVDKTFGFEIQIPAGWRYDRTGAFGPGGSLVLLRGASNDNRATLQILVFQNLKTPFAAWLDGLSKELGTVNGARWVQVKGGEAGSRTAYVSARADQGVEQVDTVYYCTLLDDRTVWAMSLAYAGPRTPDADVRAEKPVPPLLQSLVGTFRVVADPSAAAGIGEALERGRSFINRFQLQEAIRKLRLDQNLRYYEIVLDGKPVGYMTRRFSREQHGIDQSNRSKDDKDGLRVRESTWRFFDDGAARYSVVDLFSSLDNETDLYQIWESVVPAESGGKTPPVVTTHDQCIREGDVLFSSFSNSADKWLPEPRRPIRLTGGFLGLAWMRAMPAMAGGETAPPIGFHIYDVQTRALVSHVIRPLGPADAATDGPAFAYETREGLVSATSRLVTDGRGNMLRFESGPLLIRPSDAKAIETSYGPRRAAARARLSESGPKGD